MVTRITDGVTFEVSSLGCVRLADVMSVNPNSQAGLEAREFTRDNLMGTQVFLDIDNKTGPDKGGCWMCVVYRANANGTANLEKNFNKMYVDAGYGMARDVRRPSLILPTGEIGATALDWIEPEKRIY